MPSLADLITFLEAFAPPTLAESWDNVGLLVGDRTRPLELVMTCLTVTRASADEAIAERADTIVTHHPLPFRPFKRLTADTHEGRLLLDLIAAGVAIYSPHTAFDSTWGGINEQLAAGLALADVRPLVPAPSGFVAPPAKGAAAGTGEKASLPSVGGGRFGQLRRPIPLRQLAESAKRFLGIDQVQVVGSLDQSLERVAVACGSAGEFLQPAQAAGCQVLVTGETRFHTCLEAEALEVALILVGHFASERFALESLAQTIARQFPAITVWRSRRETDPLVWA